MIEFRFLFVDFLIGSRAEDFFFFSAKLSTVGKGHLGVVRDFRLMFCRGT